MAEEIVYQPPHTHRAADGVGSSAGDLRARLEAFEREITGDGDAFGADDLGAVIATIYGAVHQLAFESYGDNTGELDAYAGNLQAMGTTQEHADDLPLIEINRVREMLG
ncbi:hypothetical protein ACWDA3_41775 [Nonomuraea rubra]